MPDGLNCLRKTAKLSICSGNSHLSYHYLLEFTDRLIRYEPGEQYLPHTDWFHDRPEGSSQRICTVIVYLRAPEEGGETIFPNTELSVPVKAVRTNIYLNSLKPDYFLG